LVNAMGIDAFKEAVEAEWSRSKHVDDTFTQAQIDDLKAQFPAVASLADQASGDPAEIHHNPLFNQWYQSNTKPHRDAGRRIVFVSLKTASAPAGDATAEQMKIVAKLASDYSESEIRTTHEQNLVLPHVVCPGLDFCSLANAGTITIYDQINERFDNLDYIHELGDIGIKISGCMNACGHHHVGDIGILGVEKGGVEWYQLTLGGHAGNKAAIGKRLGKAIPKDEVADAIEKILNTFIEHRLEEENFNSPFERIGIEPFKEHVYAIAA